ncbi:sigma factor-like helix-turn-helix DNA-binding protein, partial [Staphylococcus xylosus]|uniref:sigma factor-like helix-turn-helix DNA-binding protein n=1 Tax=Staphylococcus xylosus TaxID=1288 RepID=UPI000D487690
NSNEKYNLYNHELHELLSAHGKNYLEFMNEYFCEDNLLSDRPYEYGQTVVNEIFENYNVEHESYLINLNSKLTKLTNHDNYILIKDIPISDIINYYELSNIFLKETRLVKELGTKLYDDAIIKILLKFIEELPNFTETNDELFKTVSEKEFKILRDRNNGKTLEEIANQISVTRERVRQIEAKAKRNLKASCVLKKTTNFIMFKYRNKSIIQLSQILKNVNLDLEYNFVIAILLEESSKYLVNIEYMLLISHKVYRNMQNEVDWYINNGNLVIPLNELKYINEENIEFATKLLSGFNYKLVNNNFVKSNLTIVAALEHIMYINKEEIFINSHEDYEILKNKVENLFDKRIDSSPRALFSRVADARNVILIDKNAYKYEDFRDIDGNFLSELKQFVNEEFNQGQYADPRLIYKNNTELMKINKVYSYSHLYSIIKNFFSEDFKVGHQNTLYIYPKESNNLTAEDILTKYLKERPVVSIDKVLKELKWKRIKLEQIIPRLTDVILNGNQEIILIEGIEEEEDYDALYNLVNNEIEKGYLITADLYTKIAFDENLSLLINKYNIIDLHGFAQFVKSKFMYMMGHSQFLYSKYTEYRNIEDIIVSKLPQMISAKELRDFVVDKGYSEQRYYKTKNLLVDENKIIPYSNDIYLNLEKFNFSSNIEGNLLEILKVKLKENIY